MSKKNIAQALEVALADTYTLYLKTQNYHWNVTGSDFRQLHLLFEEQYTELFIPIDTIAERIRAIGAHAPGSFKEFEKLKTIEEAIPFAEAQEMVKDLYGDQERIIKSLNKVLKVAKESEDEVTIGLATERIASHEKNHWMLRAILGDSQEKIHEAA